MSRIHELGVNFTNLPALIAVYEDAFNEVEDHLRLSGKVLDRALYEQSTYPIYYSQRRAELKTIMKFLDAQVASVRGRLTRKYNENYNPKLGERMMNSYIDAEEEYLKINELYLEVSELYDKYDAAVDAFDKRGFALRDLTTARVHSIQNATL